MSIVDTLLDELRDEEKAKRFWGEGVARIAGEPSLRLVLLQALLGEAATKRDLNDLKTDLYKRIDDLRNELNGKIEDTNKRIDLMNDRMNELRADMRTYFFGFMGGILATIIVTVLLRVL